MSETVRPEAGGCLFIELQGMSLNFAVTARVHGPLTLAELQAGLAVLGRRHPLMAVRAAARPDGTPYFTDEGVPPVPVRVVERHTENDWVGETERGVTERTHYLEGPMLRCVWLRGEGVSDLILICDHMVSDGLSGIIAVRDLMAALADPSAPVEPVELPPLHELVPARVMEQLRVDAESMIPLSDTPPPEEEQPHPPLAPVRVVPFELSHSDTAALVGRCRAQRVTVQAALCAAFLRPFAERHPEQPLRRAEIPVDLRSRMERQVGDACGNLIGLTTIGVDCGPERDLWDVAREAVRELGAMRDRDLFATAMVTIALFGRIAEQGPWVINYDVSISNMGRVNIPVQYGERRLESIYGPVFPATGPDHLILGISTFDGVMRCTWSSRGDWAAPLLARGREVLAGMIA